MNPIQVSRSIAARLEDRIRYALPVERSVPAFGAQLDDLFSKNPLSKGPFLEITPPYEQGATLGELARQGVIRSETAHIFAQVLRGGDPDRFHLYRHQESAVRKALDGNDPKNLVVCSGTGSGKTECFLLPVTDRLVREQAAGTLGNGVRTMLLYPMNALVYDQIKRLRSLLRNTPYIRFGRYTGDLDPISQEPERTKYDQNLLRHFQQLNRPPNCGFWFDDEGQLDCELTTRTQWRDNPGHILVTNYSMLEYLLLRPEDSSLFGPTWQFIILDEAHCYTGSMGTEIAWLIRRVRQRLQSRGHKMTASIQYLATSATLISGALDPAEKAQRVCDEFASKLFPAKADSFHVQFGEAASYVPPPQACQWTDGQAPDYCAVRSTQVPGNLQIPNYLSVPPEILGGGLFELTQWHMTQAVSLSHIMAFSSVIRSAAGGKPVAFGDLLAMLRMVLDSRLAGLIPTDVAPLCAGFLHQYTVGDLGRTLVPLTKAGIGDFTDADAWREILHDPMDRARSNYPGDNNRRGNRLRFLLDWQRNALDQSVESAECFLRAALKAASEAALDGQGQVPLTKPEGVPALVTDAARRVLDAVHADLQTVGNAISALGDALTQAWCGLLPDACAGDGETSAAGAVARLIGGAPHLHKLHRYLRDATVSAERGDPAADTCALQACAKAVFGTDAEHSLEECVALIDLASLACPSGERHPLLELRYHQFVRGLQGTSVRFVLDGDRIARDRQEHPCFSLAPDAAGEDPSIASFSLGVCRTCGQPFLLGYLPAQQYGQIPANQGLNRFFFSPVQSESHPFMYAFAWIAGNLPDGPEEDDFPADQDNGYRLDVRSGILYAADAGNLPDDADRFCLASVWLAGTHQPRNQPAPGTSSFIRQCPCCGDAQDYRQETEYGIITPFEFAGGQARLSVLDQLVREVPPSLDARARRHPGGGRKALSFSDSRSGAARLALDFQSQFLQSNGHRMLRDAMQWITAATDAQLRDFIPCYDDGVRQRQNTLAQTVRPAQRQAIQNAINAQIEQFVWPCRATEFQWATSAFVDGLRRVALDELFEMSGEDGNPLPDVESALLRILYFMTRTGRYSLLQQGIVEAYSNGLEQASCPAIPGQPLLDAQEPWRDFLNETKLKSDIATGLCQVLYRRLLEMGCVTTDTNWPAVLRYGRAILVVVRNGEVQLPITGGNGGQGQQFEKRVWASDSPSSALNRIVRQKLGLGQDLGRAKGILDALWPVFRGAGVLVEQVPCANGQSACQVDRNDILLRLTHPSTEFDLAHALKHERELHRSMDPTQPIIPVRIEEHTAQLANERAAAVQKAFSQGRVNIISCSTTFEMGVDVGDLSAVFLANMPPEVANYRQRAGRAGRRAGTPAYVLSFVHSDPHSLYFWEHPERILFGAVTPPRIHLEAAVIRARHLRAEALHDFLAWMGEDARLVDRQGRNDRDGNAIIAVPREWDSLGDFFFGVRYVRPRRQPRFVRSRTFRPIVDELPAWVRDRAEAVREYAEELNGMGLPYNPAHDLIFQLRHQQDAPTQPYPLDAAYRVGYSELAGPNTPSFDDAGVVTPGKSLQEKLRDTFHGVGAGGDVLAEAGLEPEPYQRYMLKRRLIQTVSRHRILPKYGFPVDVVPLLPNAQDEFGGDVELERDLRIGLFEYAPGQEVVADKRVYESLDEVRVYRGNVGDALRDCLICRDCGYTEWPQQGGQQMRADVCPLCQGNQMEQICALQPDAFCAKKSRPAGGYSVPRSSGFAQHVFVAGIRLNTTRDVAGLRLQTAEANEPLIHFLNRGPRNQGFNLRAHGQRYTGISLFHEMRTDVAIWRPHPDLFLGGNNARLAALGNQNAGTTNRLTEAMRSALYAIVRAIARKREIQEREIGGLLYPVAANAVGFVLFDDTSGGAGHVQNLTLTGNDAIDHIRRKLIREILTEALKLADECTGCGTLYRDNADKAPAWALKPVSRETYITLADAQRAQSRLRCSCPNCLRSSTNRRHHLTLDRFDAALVLRALLGQGNG